MAPEEAASAVKEANEIIAREREQRVRETSHDAEGSEDVTEGQPTGAGHASSASTSRTYQQPLSFIPYRRSSSCPPVGETLASLSNNAPLTLPIRRPSPPAVPHGEARRQHTISTGSSKSSSSRKGVMNGGIDLPSVSFNTHSFNGSVARRTPLPIHGNASPYPPPSSRPRGAGPTPMFDPQYAPTRLYDPQVQGPNSRPSSSGSGRRGGLCTDDSEQREAIEEAARSRAPQTTPGAGLFDPSYSLSTYSLSGNQPRMVAQGGSPPAYAPPAYPPPPPQMNIGSPMPIMTDAGAYVPQSPLDGTAPAFQALGLNSPVSANPVVQYPNSVGPPAHDGWIQHPNSGGYVHDASAAPGYAMQYDASAYTTHAPHHPYHPQDGDGMIGGVQEGVPVLDYTHTGVDLTLGGMMSHTSRGMDYSNPMQLEIPPTHKELPPYPLSDPSQHLSSHPPQFHQHHQQHPPPLQQLVIGQQHPGNGFTPPSGTPGYSSSSSASSTPQPASGALPTPIDMQKANHTYTSPIAPPPHPSRTHPSPRSPFLAVPQPVSSIPSRLSTSGDMYFDWNAATSSPAVPTHPHTSQTQNHQQQQHQQHQHHHNAVSQTSPTTTVDQFSSAASYDMSSSYRSLGYTTDYDDVNHHPTGNTGSYGGGTTAPVTTGGGVTYGFGTGSGGFGGSMSGSLGLGGGRRLSRRTSSLWMRRSSLAGDLAGVGLGEY